MEYKGQITFFKYCIAEEKKYFWINGWCFASDSREIKLKVIVNEKNREFELKKMIQKNIQREFPDFDIPIDSGFQLKIPLDTEEPERFKLYVEGEQKPFVLANYEKKQILRNSVEYILYALDEISADRAEGKCRFRINGWAIPLDKSNKISLQIKDSKGNGIELTNTKRSREDLCKLGIISEEEKMCGFQIGFDGSTKEDYMFYIKAGMKTIRKKVSIYEIENYTRKQKINNVIKTTVRNFQPAYMKVNAYYLLKYGPKKMFSNILSGVGEGQKSYAQFFKEQQLSRNELRRQRKKSFSHKLKISIIVPTFNTPLKFLREMIESVQIQTYSNWELCLGDGSVGNKELRATLKQYAENDKRIKIKILAKNEGISGNTNGALSLASGDYIALLDHDDILAPNALYEVAMAVQEGYEVIYTDEDMVSADLTEHLNPNLKSDFNIDLLCSHNYITHFFVAKKTIVDRIQGFNSEYDGSQDYDFIFRCIEQTNKIRHIPKILYHWRMHEASVAGNPSSKMYAYDAGKRAIQAHYNRLGINALVEMTDDFGMYHTAYDILDSPLISIIIPNKDHINDLKRCIDALFDNNYVNFEIIIIENCSIEEETFQYYEKIKEKYPNVLVVQWKETFNYSAINNYGVTFAKGDYLLFLNNDTQMVNSSALTELLGCCMRSDVGAVGAKLLFEDDTVQHAGIVIGLGGVAGHVLYGIDKGDIGYMYRAINNCNYSAVTAACMMVKKALFQEVNGFEEKLKVAYNDIDFCLKLREKGYLIVYNAYSHWYHFESKSRGYETDSASIKRLEEEASIFKSRWKEILEKGDPFYNPNFSNEAAYYYK